MVDLNDVMLTLKNIIRIKRAAVFLLWWLALYSSNTGRIWSKHLSWQYILGSMRSPLWRSLVHQRSCLLLEIHKQIYGKVIIKHVTLIYVSCSILIFCIDIPVPFFVDTPETKWTLISCVSCRSRMLLDNTLFPFVSRAFPKGISPKGLIYLCLTV